jgi:hypothetical protein
VQWAHPAEDTSALREGSRLERALRNRYIGMQYAFISAKIYTEAGKINVGID